MVIYKMYTYFDSKEYRFQMNKGTTLILKTEIIKPDITYINSILPLDSLLNYRYSVRKAALYL